MKKVFAFLRSMRFGMILLVLVMLCALAGSMIPQGEPDMTYVRAYGASAAVILKKLGFTDIFHTWYFILLEILLCGNLILCSVLRFPAARRAFDSLKAQARAAEPDQPLEAGQAETVREVLRRSRFRQEGSLWYRNGVGVYGSFLVHLSILVVLLFGSLVLMTPQVQDRTVMPGDSLTLEDGTAVTCLSFHIEDETGRLDYASRLRAVSPDGGEVKEQEIRVNEPMRFRGYKIYQQTYGTAGRVLIRNSANGAEESMYLTEPCFLSIDGRNGVYYRALYPGFLEEDDGSYTLITNTSMGYADPVYDVQSVTEGSAASVLVFPGETLQIGEHSFTFLDPAEYPGLRIKRLSPILYGCLYFGFALMVAALYLCFFATPACVRVEEDGFAIRSPKPQEGLLINLKAALDGANSSGGKP